MQIDDQVVNGYIVLIVQKIIQNHQNIALPSQTEIQYKKPQQKPPSSDLSIAIHWRAEFKTMIKKNKFNELIQKSTSLNPRQCFQNLLYMLSLFVYKCDRKFLNLNSANAAKFYRRKNKIWDIQTAIMDYLDEIQGRIRTKQFS